MEFQWLPRNARKKTDGRSWNLKSSQGQENQRIARMLSNGKKPQRKAKKCPGIAKKHQEAPRNAKE